MHTLIYVIPDTAENKIKHLAIGTAKTYCRKTLYDANEFMHFEHLHYYQGYCTTEESCYSATKYSRSNIHEEKAINAKSDQISYNMHSDDLQGYCFCTYSEQNIFLVALNIIIMLTLNN